MNRTALAREGNFLASLFVRPTQSAGEWAEPVDELAEYIQKMVGKPIPREKPDFPVRFLVELDVQCDLDREEFELSASESQIVLRARTTAGLSHGVHYFLQELCGVRWLWPGESGEVVPRNPDLAVLQGTWRQKPDYLSRRIGLDGAVWERYDLETAERVLIGISPETIREFNRWAWRNRLGGWRIADGHRMAMILSPEKYGADHPDYFALNDGRRNAVFYNGKHGNQPCTGNPEVLDRIAEFVIAEFDARPDLDTISISPNDGGGLCQCDACRAIDDRAGRGTLQADTGAMAADAQPVVHIDGTVLCPTSHTDRIMIFANEIYRRVREKHPGKKLLLHIYGAYREPPKSTRLDAGIIAQFCTQCNRYTDPAWRANELEKLGFLAQNAGTLGIYEYYEQGAWPGIHRLFPHRIAESVRDFYTAGVRFFATQPGRGFAVSGINTYVLARMLWDTRQNVEDLIDDFCAHAFGPAGKVMRAYLDAFERQWTQSNALEAYHEQHVFFAIPRLYDPDFRADRRRDLDRALGLAETAGQKARIEFFRLGLDFTDQLCRLCEQLCGLRDELTPEFPALEPSAIPASPTPGQKQFLQNVRREQRTLMELAERFKGRFVFPEFWFHYCLHRNWKPWQTTLDALAQQWGLENSL